MNICFIRPSGIYKGLAISLLQTAPLGLAYVAGAVLNAGYNVKVIDAAVEGLEKVQPFKYETFILGLSIEDTILRIGEEIDVISVSCMFTNNWLFERDLLIEIKKRFPNKILIIGGEHASAVPELCFKQVQSLDYVVLGEGEATMVELLNAIKDKKEINQLPSICYRNDFGDIVKNELKKPKRISQINKISWPAWDLFPMDYYFQKKISYGVYKGNTLPIMASRGCPYECTFCSSPQMWGRKYELRDVVDVVNEIEHWKDKYDIKNFDFFDLTAIIKKDWFIALCDEIISRGIKITYQIPAGTRSEAIDKEVAQKLMLSGCSNITYAPESGSKKILKDIKKKVDLSNMLQSIKWSNRMGMNIKLNIIIGFPDESHFDIFGTLFFLIKASWYGAHDMYPAIFSPYPGSSLFDRLEKEKKVNLETDEYLLEIINSHDLWPGKIYNDKMSCLSLKIYSILSYFVFYGSNYLFRPYRIYKTIKNLLTGKHESRAEMIIDQTYRKLLAFKWKKKASIVNN